MWCRSGPSRVRPLPFGSLQMLRTARPVQVDMYVRVCVIGFGSWDRLNFRPSCLLRPSAGAAVTGLHHGRRGVAPAPRFQLYVRCAGPCHARGGCRAPVSVSGSSVAQGAV